MRASGLLIRPTDLEAIRCHGEDMYPEECCGLLLGRIEIAREATGGHLIQLDAR